MPFFNLSPINVLHEEVVFVRLRLLSYGKRVLHKNKINALLMHTHARPFYEISLKNQFHAYHYKRLCLPMK